MNIDRYGTFAESAHEYCRWVETLGPAADAEHRQALCLLASLYSAALDLPEVEPDESYGWVESNSYDEYLAVHRRFASLPFQYYSDVFDPHTVPSEEVGVGDVQDDLADVYLDVREGLTYWRKGEAVNALWVWKGSFRTHWGKHAVSAMHALHTYGS